MEAANGFLRSVLLTALDCTGHIHGQGRVPGINLTMFPAIPFAAQSQQAVIFHLAVDCAAELANQHEQPCRNPFCTGLCG
jgi:hypothetical protein